MAKPSLEKRAKKLLKWKITGEGEIPNPFTEDFLQEVDYLVKMRYATRNGETSKSLSYEVTPEGREWAMGE